VWEGGEGGDTGEWDGEFRLCGGGFLQQGMRKCAQLHCKRCWCVRWCLHYALLRVCCAVLCCTVM
jgi:hypothetical protein